MATAPDRVEAALVGEILDGTLTPGDVLAGERDMAARFGVTRPTVRNALVALARDGWLTVRPRRPTVVNDPWRDGTLNVLTTVTRHPRRVPPSVVGELLAVRSAIAPHYARLAVAADPAPVLAILGRAVGAEDVPEVYAEVDWEVHRALVVASDNRIYPLLLNSFEGLYGQAARRYFRVVDARRASRVFYLALLSAAAEQDPDRAAEVTRDAMVESEVLWARLASGEAQ